jgi:hypothetical protein
LWGFAGGGPDFVFGRVRVRRLGARPLLNFIFVVFQWVKRKIHFYGSLGLPSGLTGVIRENRNCLTGRRFGLALELVTG